jgi:hypothetical protein
MCIAYKKADENAIFMTLCMFDITLAGYVCIPMGLLSRYFFSGEIIAFVVTGGIVYVLGSTIIELRYNKKRIKKILVKYRDHEYNERIKTRVIFTGVIIAMLGGIPIGFYIGRYLILGIRAIAEML